MIHRGTQKPLVSWTIRTLRVLRFGLYLMMSATLLSIWMENIAWTRTHRVTPGSECGSSFSCQPSHRDPLENPVRSTEGDEDYKEGHFTLLAFLFLEIATPFIIQVYRYPSEDQSQNHEYNNGKEDHDILEDHPRQLACSFFKC